MDLTTSFFAIIGIISLSYILYEDIKSQQVSPVALILLCVSIGGEFLYLQLSLNYISSFLICALFFLFYLYRKVGAADIILAGSLGLTLPLLSLPLFLILSGIFGLFSYIFFRSPAFRFPFTPCLFLGWLFTYLSLFY